MKKVLALLFVVMMVMALAACDKNTAQSNINTDVESETEDVAEIETEAEIEEATEEDLDFVSWPSGGLFDVLPKPKSNDIIISYESDTYISIEVHNTSQEDFTEYVGKMRDMGYKDRQDKQIADHVFNAVNSDGYEIMSSVADVSRIMYIQFKSPDSTSEF